MRRELKALLLVFSSCSKEERKRKRDGERVTQGTHQSCDDVKATNEALTDAPRLPPAPSPRLLIHFSFLAFPQSSHPFLLLKEEFWSDSDSLPERRLCRSGQRVTLPDARVSSRRAWKASHWMLKWRQRNCRQLDSRLAFHEKRGALLSLFVAATGASV